jgi:hypothetical protein
VLGAFAIVAVVVIWPRATMDLGDARRDLVRYDSSADESLTTLAELLPSFGDPPPVDEDALAWRIPGEASWPESEGDGSQIASYDSSDPKSYEDYPVWLDLLFHGRSIFSRQDPDSISVEGDLAREEVAAIQRLVRGTRGIDRTILSIEMIDENEAEITTGFVRGPLNGGGNVLRAKRRDRNWRITSISWWVS